MVDDAWRAGFALLRKYDFSFDLQVPWWHLAEAADLARSFPETQIIINHTGLPGDRSPEGMEGWSNGMQTISRCNNVSVKISGICVPGEEWTLELNREIVLRTIDNFGTDRCMFASNFPVDRLIAGFGTIFNGFSKITQGFSEAEKKQLFCSNAMRTYRISEDTLAKRLCINNETQ